jgi:protein Mpv17
MATARTGPWARRPQSLSLRPACRSFTTSSSKKTFLSWYEGHLEARPVLTKMATGSVLWGLGDAVAQVVPTLVPNETSSSSEESYDWERTGRAVLFGSLIHAPLSHLHYNFLEYLTVKTKMTGYNIPIFKAFMEQFVYWSWFSNSLYHGAMGLMQGMTLQQCYDRIAAVLWETQKAQWVFWIPIQLINFQYTPVRHQLNVVLVTSIVWTAFLSFCYPPQKKEKQAAKPE